MICWCNDEEKVEEVIAVLNLILSLYFGGSMRITFWGAAQEVTGSMHLIEVNGARILLDCGMYQGKRSDSYERNLHLPFDPKGIDAVVLSHAHIDHSGNLPNLVKQGFRGHVWCSAATRNLCVYMLQDSGKIQESDVEYLNKKRVRQGEAPIAPLYTQADAQAALGHFVSVGYHRPVAVADGVSVTFYCAGHILGSTFVALDIHDKESGKDWRVVFSGDIGRAEIPIVKSPEHLTDADILIMESTYGDRLHGAYQDAGKKLRDLVRDTIRRHGRLIIPSFAVGRTQEIVFALNQLEAEGDIPPIPIFVDSPLAVSATEVFRMHPEEWDDEVRAFLAEGKRPNPFDSKQIEYVRDPIRSKQLNYLTQPAIIISASGMAESGRILHHLKNGISDPNNTIVFVGYQAENTLGRRILDGQSPVRILGEEFKVRAQVVAIDGFSAHADQAELLEWARSFERGRLRQTFVVHGEPEAQSTLAEKLAGEHMKQVTIPQRGQSFDF
jgi:metallo-beta-lactamase family protein